MIFRTVQFELTAKALELANAFSVSLHQYLMLTYGSILFAFCARVTAKQAHRLSKILFRDSSAPQMTRGGDVISQDCDCNLIQGGENYLITLHRSRKAPNSTVSKFTENHSSKTGSNSPIKVMYIINDLSIGGAEMMLYKLLAETDRNRFAPVVISLMHHAALRQRIEALGIEVYTTKMRPGLPSPMGLWRLVQLMRRIKPDLIFGWMYHSCIAAHLGKLFSYQRAPVLWSLHYSIGALEKEKWLTAMAIKVCAFLSKLPSQIIFVSRAAQSQHYPLGYDLKKSCVIPNGIDVSEFVPSRDARSSVRAELGLPENAFLIGLMGRYHRMKDHANFLRAAGLLSKLHPEAQFVLIGRNVDSANQNLCDSITQLGLADQTHLLGERHDVSRLAAAMDVFSLSSAYGESFPNVVGEAMACEVPCVVTDVGDTAWILGNTGRVVPPGNSVALADAWREMIDLGPSGRQDLGRQARSRVIENFTLASVVARYDSLYEQVLTKDAPVASENISSPVIASLKTTLKETGAP